MRLSEIVHVELVKNLGALGRHAGAGDDGVGYSSSNAQTPFEIRSIQSLEHEVHGLHHVVLEIGNGAAERGSDSRQSRHQGAIQSNLTHEGAGVQRAAAAKRHEDEVIGIMPALDGDKAYGSRHFRFGHAHDGLRRLRN